MERGDLAFAIQRSPRAAGPARDARSLAARSGARHARGSEGRRDDHGHGAVRAPRRRRRARRSAAHRGDRSELGRAGRGEVSAEPEAVKKLVILAAVLFATTAWAKTFDGCGVRFSYPEMSHAQSVCDRPAGERE